MFLFFDIQGSGKSKKVTLHIEIVTACVAAGHSVVHTRG
jgi:hypothetical protein